MTLDVPRFSTGSLSSVQSTHRLVQAALRMVTCFARILGSFGYYFRVGRPMVLGCFGVSPDSRKLQQNLPDFAGELHVRFTWTSRTCTGAVRRRASAEFAAARGIGHGRIQRFCAKNDKLCGPRGTAMTKKLGFCNDTEDTSWSQKTILP